MHRLLVPALAAPLVCGCPPPATETPQAPPVVEVSSPPAPPPELEEVAEVDTDPSSTETTTEEEDAASKEEAARQQEVADAVASLTATSGLGTGWGSGSVPGGLGTLGTNGGFGLGPGKLGTARVSPPGQDPQVRGSLPKEVIRRVVRRNLHAIERCYDRQLSQDPGLSGKVVVKFVISRSGAVAQATVTEGLQDELDRCVRNVAIRMMFPQPEGGGVVVVTYPFVFQSTPSP